MGLDMYAYTTAETVPDVDFACPNDARKLHYWRKHPNLHGWMEALYRSKGGGAEDFNCEAVMLTADDLDRLEAAVRSRTLPPTQGFLFGVSTGAEHDGDLAFIAKARATLASGLTVFYTSWW